MISIRVQGREETIPLDEFEARVRQGQIAPSTPVRLAVLTGEHWVDARELELFRRLYMPARIHFTRVFSLGRFPIFTALLCAVQVAIFFYVAGWERMVSLDALVDAGAKWRPNVLELGETWRLLTANVLHRDVLHLFFNLFFLFNVGGSIENAYRLKDYLLILVVSALGTTCLSTMMSDRASVGASGVVLGLFGAASVFGYKYADILPRRYRRYFGGAVLPYAIFILYVGLASKDTDNWGHLGGILAGLMVTLWLQPRLLYVGRPRPSRLGRLGPHLIVAGLMAVTWGAGPVIRAVGPKLELVEEESSGIRFVHPMAWHFGENHLAYPARGNALGASLGVRAERRTTQPFELSTLRERFLKGELAGRERDGEITAVQVLGERPFLIEGGRAVDLTVALESRAGPQITRNILIERGYYAYKVILSAPRPWAQAYAPVFAEMMKAITLTEPSALVHARALQDTFPGMRSAHVELGNQLALIGEVQQARQAYLQALSAVPEDTDAAYGLARLTLDYGGDLQEAERMGTALFEREPDEPSHAALLADLRRRLGKIDGACAVLQESLDKIKDPPEDLRARLTAMSCRGGGWSRQ